MRLVVMHLGECGLREENIKQLLANGGKGRVELSRVM